jgi:hypothetical protein
VAVIGTGALASEVVLAANPAVVIDVWGRSSERVLPSRPAGLSFSLLADAAAHRGTRTGWTTVVVAAPAGSKDINTVLECYSHVANVVDLRSSDQQSGLDSTAPVVLLGDLLAQAAHLETSGAPRVRAARAQIHDLAAAFAGHEQVRPFGWDDVCA